jgi:hypothetical protein
MVLLLAACSRVPAQQQSARSAGPLRVATPSFTVVPPGPVSDKASVELRVAVPNLSVGSRTAEVSFFWDVADRAHLIAAQTASVAPHERALVHHWANCARRTGSHTLIARVTHGGRATELRWPLTIAPSDTTALPRFGAVWFDPGGLTAYAHEGAMTEAEVRGMVDAMHSLAISAAIITYVEYFGRFYYPSAIRFYDRDTKAEASGMMYDFDVVEAVLAAADRHGMHVFLGLGRGGDTPLLWDFEAPDWAARNEAAVHVSQRVASELWRRYRHHGSLYGWYLTHEMADLAKAAAYYDPVAEFCHALSPDKPVMVAPAGTPVITPALLRASQVDVFAYGDAVGAGYVPGKYTYQPENRLRMLDGIYRQYRAWHEGTGKHLWTDLELWEMDGSQGYAGACPAAWERVRRQLAAEAPYVEFITAYEISGFMQAPGAGARLKDVRAERLYSDYGAYLRTIVP